MGELRETLKGTRQGSHQLRGWSKVFVIFIVTILIFYSIKFYEDRAFFVLSSDTFLTIHVLLELLSVLMSFSIFSVTYFTSGQTNSAGMIIMASTFLAVAFFDSAHTFSYKGMPTFMISPSPITATVLWLVSRVTMVIGILVAVLIPEQKKIIKNQAFIVSAAAGLAVLSIAIISRFTDFFTIFYLEETGITPLKIWIEYLITVLLVVTAIIYQKYFVIDRGKKEYSLMVMGLFINGFGEMAFTMYNNVYDIYNLIGHFYKLLGYFLLFRGLININVSKPYKDLFAAEKQLSNYVEDLEKSVRLRTKEITEANEKIMKNLRDAKHIQNALMTTEFPKIQGMEFAAKYLPCEQVGGDFYNIFRLDEDKVGIVIGDVAGHGVSAAMVNVFINQSMRFRVDYDDSRHRILTPRGVLSNLYHVYNNMSFPEEMYAVLFYGIYDYKTGELSYASAGMNTRPIIIKQSGETVPIELEGFPICRLGSVFKPSYETKTISIAQGDTLVLYSDGLGEIDRKRPDLFSSDKIMEYLKGMEDYSAQEICEELTDAYYTLLAGNVMMDDVTILVVKNITSGV